MQDYKQVFFTDYDQLLDFYNDGTDSFYYYFQGKYHYIATESLLWDAYESECRIFVKRYSEKLYQHKISQEISTCKHILDNPENYSTEKIMYAEKQLNLFIELL